MGMTELMIRVLCCFQVTVQESYHDGELKGWRKGVHTDWSRSLLVYIQFQMFIFICNITLLYTS